MHSGVHLHWDLASVIFYVFLGYAGAYAIKKGKRVSYAMFKIKGKYISLDMAYIVWFFLWTFVASFRLVNQYGVGGVDAYTYASFFKMADGRLTMANSVFVFSRVEHYGLIWQELNRVIRFFTDDYHVYFIIVYGFIVWTYQKVIKSFYFETLYVAPFICLFFVYLTGFNTIRTEVAAAFILLVVLELRKENYKKAVFWGCIATLIHVASALYCLLIPFYYFFRKRNMSIVTIIIMLVISIIIGIIAQTIIGGVVGQILGHSYASYARMNIEHNFFDNFWKITFGQLLLGMVMLLFNNKINKHIPAEAEVSRSIQFVRKVCIFDVLSVPIAFSLNIWRGYEYLYILRLLMWSYITFVFLKGQSQKVRYVICGIEVVVFTFWLIFRINHTWEKAGLLPYVLLIFN